MALAVDKFRQAAMGSRKRTSQWLHERLREAIDISQMDANTTSVDKALALGGDSKIQIGAQADPRKSEKPPKPTKPPKDEKPNKKPEKTDKVKPDQIRTKPWASTTIKIMVDPISMIKTLR